MRPANLLLCLLTAAALLGCGEERTRPPGASLTVVNAAPGFAALNVRRGADRSSDSPANLGTPAFTGLANVNIDADTYDFYIESIDAATGFATPRAQFTTTLSSTERNFFVLTEQNGGVVPLIIPGVTLDVGGTDFDLTLIHAAQSAPTADFYLAPAGTDLTTIAPLGTLAFGEHFIAPDQAAADLVLTMTAAGNPTSVLYTSDPTPYSAGVPTQIIMVPDINGVDGVYTAHVIAASSFVRTDVNSPALIRFINGAADQLSRDFYVGGDFSAPFSAAVPVATATEYLELPPSSSQISVTPAGNPSVVEAESTTALTRGRRFEFLIAGPSGDLGFVLAADTQIPNNRNASILIMNAVSYYDLLNVYLTLPGTDVTTVSPTWQITAPVITARVPFTPGGLELTVTDASNGTVVHGPSAVTLAARGIYSIAITDSGDGTTVTPLLLGDFQ